MPDFLLKIIVITLIFAVGAMFVTWIAHSFRLGRIYTREFVHRSTDPLAFWLYQIISAIVALAFFYAGMMCILRF